MIPEVNKFICTENDNVAYKKPSSQSSVVKDPSLATDGSRFDSPTETCSLTSSQKDPWWRVDLEKEVLIRDVYIYISSSSQVSYVLEIRIGNHDEPDLKENSLCGKSFRFRGEAWRRARCPVPLFGRFVMITRLVDNGKLMLCEVEVRQEGKPYNEWKSFRLGIATSQGDAGIVANRRVVQFAMGFFGQYFDMKFLDRLIKALRYAYQYFLYFVFQLQITSKHKCLTLVKGVISLFSKVIMFWEQ